MVYYNVLHTGVPKPGVFWVLTPPTFLGLHPPLFREAQEWKVEGVVRKIRGERENLGRQKNF